MNTLSNIFVEMKELIKIVPKYYWFYVYLTNPVTHIMKIIKQVDLGIK